MSSSLYVLAAAFWTVLVAEMIGAKSIYTIISLAARYPRRLVVAALVCAFARQVRPAALPAELVRHWPPRVVSLASAGPSSGHAIVRVLRARRAGPEPRGADRWAPVTAFGALFFTEWGDSGQIAATAVAIQSRAWFAAWLGATLALTAKGLAALTFGAAFRERVPDRFLQAAAVLTSAALGSLALFAAR